MGSVEKHPRVIVLCTLICCILTAFLFPQSLPLASLPDLYIEPGLLALNGSDEVSLIVTGDDVSNAAHAVQRAGGRVTGELWLIDAVAALVPARSIPYLAQQPRLRSLVRNHPVQTAVRVYPDLPDPASTTIDPDTNLDDGWVTALRFPVPWNGTPDVLPTTAWISRNLVYPVKIDIGAEQVTYTGVGVTVAVLDSGVYFDEQVKSEMGVYLRKLFLGQADFIDTRCETVTINNKLVPTGQQYPDHCFNKMNFSKDGYGHGTHVAGIIWNRIFDYATGVDLGVAREASLLGIRALGTDGSGSYETVIKGVQFAVANKTTFNIRILNLSLSAQQTVPYFVDPLNRAVEQAWASGIIVIAAAGNEGPAAETITVPGNDPYVITVGAVDGRRTPGYWKDDLIPSWSSSGPTLDGFIKPDLLAPGAQIVSYMYNNRLEPQKSAVLVQQHPDYSIDSNLFRMSGTSMATAVTSGVAALMLQANPGLTPNQVKYRLMATARQMTAPDGQPAASPLQQGAGRLWAPDAVHAALPDGNANAGMDLQADLAAGWGTINENNQPVIDFAQLSKHYLGQVQKSLSDDGRYFLYYARNLDGNVLALGVSNALTNQWLLPEQVDPNAAWTSGKLVWSGGSDLIWAANGVSWYSNPLYDATGLLVWSGGLLVWSGNALYDASGLLVWSGGDLFDPSGLLVWSGGKLVWSGLADFVWSQNGWEFSAGEMFDANGLLVWSGGKLIWSGSQLLDPSGLLVWSGGDLFDAAGKLVWSGSKLVWSGGKLIWSGGKMIWSGGALLFSSGASYDPTIYDASLLGENISWSSGKLVWSGSKLVWSGASLVWAGDNTVWEAARLVWSGGKLIWSGSVHWAVPFALDSSSLSATHWVDWR